MDASLRVLQHVYTVHASRDAPQAFSVYDAHTYDDRNMYACGTPVPPWLGRHMFGNDRCWHKSYVFSLLVSELPSPKKGFTGMMQTRTLSRTAAMANKHETLPPGTREKNKKHNSTLSPEQGDPREFMMMHLLNVRVIYTRSNSTLLGLEHVMYIMMARSLSAV